MFFVAMSRHHVLCCCVSALCFPCTCYKSFFLGRKTCSLLLCLGIMFHFFLPWKEDMFFVAVSRHHVSHVHVIDLSSSAGRHVLCCCVSASCFPCTCYRSFFLGRKTCSLLLVSRHHVSHVHVIDLSSSEGRHVLCCCVSASCSVHVINLSYSAGRHVICCCLGIMFPMYML